MPCRIGWCACLSGSDSRPSRTTSSSDASVRLSAERATLAATLLIAPALAGLLWMSGGVTMLAAVAAMVLFIFVVMSAGSLLLRAVHAADMPAPAAWVLGVFATMIAMYALV